MPAAAASPVPTAAAAKVSGGVDEARSGSSSGGPSKTFRRLCCCAGIVAAMKPDDLPTSNNAKNSEAITMSSPKKDFCGGWGGRKPALAFFSVEKKMIASVVLMLACAVTEGVRVRTVAPEWEASAVTPDGEFQVLKSSDYLGKWLVLFFYPLDMTFVCPTEIVSYSEAYENELQGIAEVVGVSVDSKFSHLKWTEMSREDGGVGKLSIPLVSDITKRISMDYNVLTDDDDPDHPGVAMRGTFIIDPEGTIRAMTVHDEPLGRSVAETVRAVKGLQFADQHKGEGCPANWEPGTDSIKANPTDSKSFFKTWA